MARVATSGLNIIVRHGNSDHVAELDMQLNGKQVAVGSVHDTSFANILHAPSPDNITGTTEFGPFKFDRLGVRIPVYVISPWLEPGTGGL